METLDKIRAHYKTAFDDHMHIGGKAGTAYLGEKMGFKAGESVLDIGSGTGGPARFMAAEYGVRMTGIDLSPDYIAAAQAMGGDIRFDLGNGRDLPYEDGSFDAVLMMHVGMNVADKKSLYAEAYRVLKDGGRVGLYDVMRVSDAENFTFPVPWAEDADTSFLEDYKVIEAMLREIGFRITLSENRYDFALESLGKLLCRDDIHLPPDRLLAVGNLYKNLTSSLCTPYLILCEKALPGA